MAIVQQTITDFDRCVQQVCSIVYTILQIRQNEHCKTNVSCCNIWVSLAHPPRFERGTSAFGGQRSIQLSYGCFPMGLVADERSFGNIHDRFNAERVWPEYAAESCDAWKDAVPFLIRSARTARIPAGYAPSAPDRETSDFQAVAQ